MNMHNFLNFVGIDTPEHKKPKKLSRTDTLINRLIKVNRLCQIAISEHMPDKQVQAMYLMNLIKSKIEVSKSN